jgi:hypothetical protein
MSARIINYEEFLSLREKRGENFEFYVARLQDGYPEINRNCAVLAVDLWIDEKDDPKKRLWADAEEIDCLIKVGPWEAEVDRFATKFIPCGLVVRAAITSGKDLQLTFKKWSDNEEDEPERLQVWHVNLAELTNAEQFGLRFNFKRSLGNEHSELLENILHQPFLYAEERLGLIEHNVFAREGARETYYFISCLISKFDLSNKSNASSVLQTVDWDEISISDEEEFWDEIADVRKIMNAGGIEKHLAQVVWA